MLVVLYEDQLGAEILAFIVLFANVSWTRSRGSPALYIKSKKNFIQGIPLKGNGNVFKRCKRDLSRLAKDSKKVFAVYDQDKVGKLVGLSVPQCRSALREKLIEPCEPKSAIEIVLINKNLETVIQTIHDSGIAQFINNEVFHRALNKNHASRDSVFIQRAKASKDVREQLLAQLPDVDRLVAKIVNSLEAIEAGPAPPKDDR